ncbi:hypothetical protein [Streptomyces sp. NBC_00996]|uniref:hypothetical protein n=1 Tax=Streptomyces sp. NBC_00996 TaxID=2903710 RepID=UPI003865C379|nr:hypothetical protein OG390_30215 [Streptomyces sp. NBC_00996]
MSPREFLDLIRKVMDAEPRQRERGADEVTDHLSAYSAAEAAALATILSATASCEKGHEALEAQLHAILELTSTGHVNLGHISRLSEINLKELPIPLREYVTDLLEG